MSVTVERNFWNYNTQTYCRTRKSNRKTKYRNNLLRPSPVVNESPIRIIGASSKISPRLEECLLHLFFFFKPFVYINGCWVNCVTVGHFVVFEWREICFRADTKSRSTSESFVVSMLPSSAGYKSRRGIPTGSRL